MHWGNYQGWNSSVITNSEERGGKFVQLEVSQLKNKIKQADERKNKGASLYPLIKTHGLDLKNK